MSFKWQPYFIVISTMAITSRKIKSDTSKSKILKVDPYENPNNVLELIKNICSAQSTASAKEYWDIIYNVLYNKVIGEFSLYQYLEQYSDFVEGNVYEELYGLCNELLYSISSNDKSNFLKIVVAGGFSSGKSSFLNRITKSVNLLPTGVEPVSVVKTYLYCSKNVNRLSVKGTNLKNVMVNLDTNILQAIQHSNKSNIYLASVLNKLYIEIPSQELDGIAFIDTPGYNNTDSANSFSGKSDLETAMEAFEEGDILFWLIDCERGTTVAKDIEKIKNFKGKKLIIFNKADKKGVKEAKKIVNEAANNLKNVLDDIIDIMAFSTLDNKIYYSYNNNTSLTSIINSIKKISESNSLAKSIYKRIEEVFDEQIIYSELGVEDIDEQYGTLVKEKNQAEKLFRNTRSQTKDDNKNVEEFIQDCKLDKERIENYRCCFEELVDVLIDVNDTINTHNKSVLFSSNEVNVNDKINKAINVIDSARDTFDLIQLPLWRDGFFDWLEKDYIENQDIYLSGLKDRYEDICEECKKLLDRRQTYLEIIKRMPQYKIHFVNAVKKAVSQFSKSNKIVKAGLEVDIKPNVFDAIKKEDFNLFLLSLESGVDVYSCDKDGYTPLNMAVKTGNNAIVKYLLDKDVDPNIKDKHGMNALHTAVLHQYRDICKILVKYDPDLIDTETNNGETVRTLANQYSFGEWVKKELK